MSPAVRAKAIGPWMLLTFAVLVLGAATSVVWLDGLGTFMLGLGLLVFATEAAEPRFPLLPKEPARRRTIYRVIGGALALIGLLEAVFR